jgi:anti-sigma factor (TIGR02949 family)
MKKTNTNKFNCSDIEKSVQAYLDEKLSKKEILLFKDHLSYCLPCDKKIEFEKKLKQIIKHRSSEKSYPKKLAVELKKIIHNK